MIATLGSGATSDSDTGLAQGTTFAAANDTFKSSDLKLPYSGPDQLPTADELRKIKFEVTGDWPVLRAVVNADIAELQTKYPDDTFTVTFAGNSRRALRIMSISLTIERPGRPIESLPLASYASHKDIWAPIAAGSGLELIPQFYSFLAVRPEYLGRLLAELTAFRREFIRGGSDDWDAAIG